GRALDDHGELVGVEAGPTDQGAVDVGLGGQLLGVARLDAAAVLDAGLVGGGLADQLGHGRADDGDRLLGVVGGGGPAGADGPDGLVGPTHAGHPVARPTAPRA